MSLGGYVNKRADHRSVLLIMIPLVAASLAFALLVNSVWSFMLSFVLLSFSLGMMDLFMNAEASIVEHEEERNTFSSYHGMASLGMAVFAVIGSMVSVWLAPWFAFLFALVPLVLTWAAIRAAIPVRPLPRADENKRGVALPWRILFFIGLASGANVACEGASVLWAGQLLTTIAPEYAAISGFGLAFYGICGGFARLMGDRLREAFGDLRVMSVSLTMAVAGFVVLGLAPGFWISVLAFAAVGFGLAVIFPCLFALAARLVPNARAAALAFVAAIGGLPRVALPWILGWVATQGGVPAVFGATGFVAVIALVIIVFTFAEAQRMVPAK
jgi:MFS family permease